MKAWQIEKTLDEFAPVRSALSFDNVGLLVGDGDSEVSRVFLTLDITPETVGEAIASGAQMMISHHPIIFSPFRRLNSSDYASACAVRLARADICALCMHTNLDIARGGVNDALASALGLQDVSAIDGDENALLRVGNLPHETDMPSFASFVASALGCPGLWYQDSGRSVRRVAVCGGAGGSDEELSIALASGADVYVTSEFRHHLTIQARHRGISLIDAGHFYTEQPVIAALEAYISEKLPSLETVKSKFVPNGKYISIK